MWDLQQIIRENNRVAVWAMMQGEQVQRADAPRVKDWPLTWLSEKLRLGPPLINELIQGFTDVEDLLRFLNLVREYLPEHEDEVMQQRGSQRPLKFAYFFGEKYFPLPPLNPDLDMRLFAREMPLQIMGFSYDMYHELDMKPEYVLLLSLLTYPYQGDDRDSAEREWELGEHPAHTPFGDEVWADADTQKKAKGKTLYEVFTGPRLPVIDKVGELVGRQLSHKLPKDGWMPDELHKMLDGTQYEGAAAFADWAFQDTGCILLDTNYEDVDWVEGTTEPEFKWTRRNVEGLTAEYPKLKAYRAKIDGICAWLHADPIIRFGELLDFVLEKALSLPKRKKKREPHFYDPTEHWCPLDQYTEEEDDYDDDDEDVEEDRLHPATEADIEAATQF